MELQVVDPIAWVAARPAQFFRAARAVALSLLSYIMADVLLIGGGECRIAGTQGWWFVSSDNDWMKDEQLSVNELFSRVVADPRLGEHSMRSEILLNVFASDVATASCAEEVLLIKGQAPALELSTRQVDWGWARRSLVLRV
jgi:hypothetical protein